MVNKSEGEKDVKFNVFLYMFPIVLFVLFNFFHILISVINKISFNVAIAKLKHGI